MIERRRWLAWAMLACMACATGSREDILGERPEREPLRPVAPSALAPDSADKIPERPVKVASPEERAAAMPHDQACVRAASEQEKGGDPEGAFALLRACASLGKWRDLRRTLAPPTKTLLTALPEDQAIGLLVQIIANRGGAFESDVPLCQRWRWNLHTLDEAFEDEPLAKDAWVVFRTDAQEAHRKKSSMTMVELIRSAKDAKAAYSETSRVIVAKIPKAVLVPEDGDLIVLAHVEKAVERNADGYPEATVSVVAVMRPGTIAPDLSQ